MKWFQILSICFPMGFLLLAGVCCANADAEPEKATTNVPRNSTKTGAKSIEIPLELICAYRMPGTSPVEKIDESLVFEIRRSLWPIPPKDKKARAGFAVGGTGREALGKVHSILVKNKPPSKSIPAHSEVSIFFFSHPDQPIVHIHRVERLGSVVNIHYGFIPNENEETSEYFALIPLGEVPAGKYRVNVIQSPRSQKDVDQGFQPIRKEVARRIVCNSFSFSVSEQGE